MRWAARLGQATKRDARRPHVSRCAARLAARDWETTMVSPTFHRRRFLTAMPAAGFFLSTSAAGSAEPEKTGAKPEKKKLTLLFVGAHRDDAEIGAGGVILKALAAGH